MEDKKKRTLFALLRSAVWNEPASPEAFADYSEDMMRYLISMGQKHDVLHLIAYGLQLNGLLSKKSKLHNQILLALYRHEQMNYAFRKLCNLLEEERIPFIPLKGDVMRRFYPEAWMRTSSDIDILLHEKDVAKVALIMSHKHGYRIFCQSNHDISLMNDKNIHIELHYKLMEDIPVGQTGAMLDTVWEKAVRCGDGSYRYELPDDLFYFHHIAHTAKHFMYGGCGIKPFIDLMILDRFPSADIEKRDALLAQSGLLPFADACRTLSKIWFEGEPSNTVFEQMEQYILNGGVYGTVENRVKVRQQKKGGKVRYIFSRIFVSYDALKTEFPFLIKHKWLTPFMQVRRWFRLIFFSRAKKAAKELKYNMAVSSEEAQNIHDLLKNIGL